MKRPVLATKRQVMSAVICDYPGGRECAAARLGYELKKFDNHVYENAGSRPLSDEQIHVLEQDAGTAHLPEYIASLYGGMFVSLAKPETLDNIDLYSRSVNAAAKRGYVDQIIAKALEDGVIEAGEAEAVLGAHRRYMSARHSEVLATIQLHSKPAQGK
ncbi:Phage protein [Pseudomonas chlororaphis subsp. aurantiaca]|uniref:YmfL family putative regulatory protein n=1 Tax=Pseudomonas chlororaphis TaxID=587753 RepID=UPI000F588493|nr:YmfL family putative regulatory protein [Pseudomonas chlororaphis]AZD34644.1 Phage protein [Pseudomonas chlororaphis subsp. aurantiaca]AZD40979.1 Phage protein [Pseudomonas chlororaphis subsp. aurantiaca]